MLVLCKLEIGDGNVVWREVHLHSFNWAVDEWRYRYGVVW